MAAFLSYMAVKSTNIQERLLFSNIASSIGMLRTWLILGSLQPIPYTSSLSPPNELIVGRLGYFTGEVCKYSHHILLGEWEDSDGQISMNLGGGNSNICYFQPEPWGNDPL